VAFAAAHRTLLAMPLFGAIPAQTDLYLGLGSRLPSFQPSDTCRHKVPPYGPGYTPQQEAGVPLAIPHHGKSYD
jgi:hypothetical protein